MKTAIEIHPFPNFNPKGATHLILGSFPTLRSNWRFNFYYPGRANFFWRLMSDVYDWPFKHSVGEEAIKERRELLIAKRLAISDTIYSIRRKIATSSKDSDLEVVKKMDVLAMLRENPSLHSIILTGSSGKASAHATFYEHLRENNVVYEVGGSKPPINGSFTINKREIKVHSLYSTSGLNIGRYKEAVEQYRKYLLDK